jgi:hypothetical protein
MSRNVIYLTRKQLDNIEREVQRHPTSHAIIVSEGISDPDIRLRLLTRNGSRRLDDVILGPRGRVEPA